MFHRMTSGPQPAQKPQAQNEPQQQNRNPEFRQFQQQPASEQNRVAQQQPQRQAPQVQSQQQPQQRAQDARPQQEAQQDNPFASQQQLPMQTESQDQQPQSQQATQQEEKQSMTSQNTQSDNQSNEEYAGPRSLDIPAAAAASYQRPGQPAASVRPVAGYPGAYSPASYPNRAGQPGASAAVSSDRRLTVGRGISISGEIEACDYLVVEGTVEAALKGASIMEIAESGVFYGTVEIEEATVAGRFEGDITVNGRLTIRSTGVITGSIAYKELEVESGAVIDGRLTPVSAQNEARKQQGGKNQKKDNKGNRDAANTDGELFNAKAAAE